MARRKAPNRKAKHRIQARLNDAEIALWNELKEHTGKGNTEIIRGFLEKGFVKDGIRELIMPDLAKLTRMAERRCPQVSASLRELLRRVAGKAP